MWLSGRNSEIFSHYFQVANDGSDPNRAEHSAPNGLSIRQSHIRMAGAGVWADKPIPRGMRFGRYEGKEVHDVRDTHKSGYCWMVGCHLATTNITQQIKTRYWIVGLRYTQGRSHTDVVCVGRTSVRKETSSHT